ncbi:hydrogenase maturation protein HypF [Mucilaginibacter frigoritolerans]|uniref:Hydrogenase maturation protein HypF n=1 Tax=Mucilaginibacter frigoritolerans TaxID=652788 RepID=A0A562TS31_9SPHI|nr:carbamoyltransferase HypF [Mucilaginibacter frigoritolerans]TWI95876.1 hydrogenase maturation protein HypF [Mucilaginibacter frigoritolerans]
MQTFYIHIDGNIESAEFLPLVYCVAKEMRVTGYVRNVDRGAEIFFNTSSLLGASEFLQKIKQGAPYVEITSSKFKKIQEHHFSDFNIYNEDDGREPVHALIPADIAICNNCKDELHNSNNRRYHYPFVACPDCGPRYAILKKLPFDRRTTSLNNFSMCEACFNEYNQVNNRRFFSEINSCADCGIKLSILCSDLSILSRNIEIVFSLIKHFLNQGKILAVKGIGGYVLICDASNPDAIALLRKRKHCPTKPFALLYPDIKALENNFEISEQEKYLLQSNASPALLLYPKQSSANNVALSYIAPKLNRTEVMLPDNALFELISHEFGKPLVIAGANISGSPVIYKDEDATLYLFDVVDFIVSHNLDIVVPQDKSIMQFSKYENQSIILKRSLGMAPSFAHYKSKSNYCILATGASLESSFTLAYMDDTFISQYLGNGESYEAQLMYKHTLEHLLALYEVKPDVIIADKNAEYFAHQYATELAEKYGTEVKFVQHHEAHFAAVLAENRLLHSNKPVLGVIWDSGGLGYDDNIWGGEFFKYENNEMMRCFHIDYFPAVKSDKPIPEPRLAALCTAGYVWPQKDLWQNKFTSSELSKYISLALNAATFSSSLNSIFDAVASLLNLCDIQTYSGEVAGYLQVLAEEYVEENGFVMDESYFKADAQFYPIPTALLMQSVITDIQADLDRSYIAAKFYYSIVSLIGKVAQRTHINDICFSGDVFQNALLVDWIQEEYQDKYQLYFHINLSPNNENISFGQMVYYENKITSVFFDTDKRLRDESERAFGNQKVQR